MHTLLSYRVRTLLLILLVWCGKIFVLLKICSLPHYDFSEKVRENARKLMQNFFVDIYANITKHSLYSNILNEI